MKILSILLVGTAGFQLGKSDLRVTPWLALVTGLLAIVLHAAVRFALPHAAIEQFAAASKWSGSSLLVLMALLETVGLWLPIVLLRWSRVRTRAWVAAYVAGAALLAAANYYLPFDAAEIINGERIGPQHPSYELAVLFCLPFAAFGWLLQRASRRMRNAPRAA